MGLDALAPEQRAVIQLLAQQGRSYDELAELLRIAPDAVRERARAGLAALADPAGLDPDEQQDITDFLLGQGPEAERAATEGLVATEPEFHAWASALAGELADLRNATIPAVPPLLAPSAADIAPPEDLGTAGSGVTTTDGRTGEEPEPSAPPAETIADPGAEATPAVRARPRPARAVRPVAADGAATAPAATAPRSSRRGGLILIGVVLIAVIALIAFAATRGGDDDDGSAAASTPTAAAPSPTATGTATADSRFAQAGPVNLAGPAGSDAAGQAVIFLDTKTRTITWTLQATGLEANTDDDGYAVWLTGGGEPLRLGFNSNAPVGSDGALVLRGPVGRTKAKPFTDRFPTATNFVVSRETTTDPSEPTQIVLSGEIPQGDGADSG